MTRTPEETAAMVKLLRYMASQSESSQFYYKDRLNDGPQCFHHPDDQAKSLESLRKGINFYMLQEQSLRAAADALEREAGLVEKAALLDALLANPKLQVFQNQDGTYELMEDKRTLILNCSLGDCVKKAQMSIAAPQTPPQPGSGR